MKKIWDSVKEHLKADFDLKTYGFISLFLIFIISINYTIQLERGIIDSFRGNPIRIVWYFLLYAFAYYGGVFIYTLCKKETSPLRSPTFWLYSLFIMGILGLDGGFYAYNQWSKELFEGKIYIFAFHCLSNLFSVFTVVIPFLLFYFFIDSHRSNLYGLRPRWFAITPYLQLIVLMIPLVCWASFQPDFLHSYPSFKGSTADEFFGVSPWVTTLFYEVCYGFDFGITEWLFRGFLTIGMARFLGRGAIIPMVVCYASLHFGKPLGETVGSIFGGYILGILALQTRSIWGGIIVHVGVAWLMDLAAWLQLVWV